MENESKNLMQGLFDEMNRIREIITEYEEIPNGAGKWAAMGMRANIIAAEKAIAENDIVSMVQQCKLLQSWER